MTPLLKKIMSLARKTGDRCILIDETGDQAFVLLDLEDYEKLVSEPLARLEKQSLTAQISQDKIKPEIAKTNPEPLLGNLPEDRDFFSETSEKEMLGPGRFYLEPLE